MSQKVKGLLEVMFHTGTINPNQKMTAEDGELEEGEIPKISTIAHWITRTYAGWKKQMAEETLDL